MLRLSRAFQYRLNKIPRAVKLSGILMVLGGVVVGGGVLLGVFASASEVAGVPEHEIQVNTVEPVGNTVGNGDSVLYQVYGNTNFASATNLKLVANVTNAVFDVIPDICKTEGEGLDPISSISNNTTLICNMGNWVAGSSFRVDVAVRANGPNGGQVAMSAVLSSDAGAEVQGVAEGVGAVKTIVASFMSDIGVSGGANAHYDSYFTTNTQWYTDGVGMVIPVYWHVAVNKGSERPGSADFTANLTLSNPTHPDQAGYSGVVPFSGGACQPITGSTAVLPHIDTWATGIWEAFSNGGQANSNTNSGTCTLTGSGANYTLTVTGMDTSLIHSPTRTARDSANHAPNYGALPANEVQYASGVAMFWVPWNWIDPSGVGRASSFTATVSGYNPVSISGQVNAGENANNNSTVYTILPTGFWSARWLNTIWTANDALLPGDEMGSVAEIIAQDHEADLTTDRIICMIKGENYDFKSMWSRWAAGGVWTDNDSRITLQYTTAALPAEPLNTNCADSVGGWTTYDVNNPPANVGATRVRAVFSPGGGSMLAQLFVNWAVSDTAPIGAELWSYNMVSYDAGATWPDPNLMMSADPGMCITMTAGKRYGCVNSHHDYAYVIGAKVSVAKDTVNGGATYAVGDVVDYRVSVSTAQRANSLTRAVVTDTLPKGLEFVAGSANIEPVSVVVDGTGVTTIVWNVAGIAYNDVRDIEYKARITAGVGVRTLTNTVVADLYNESGASVLDTRLAANRSASDTINITSSGYVEIFEVAEKGVIGAEDDLVFTVTMQNHDANPHAHTDVIDVLPFNGDDRLPASDFRGTLDKLSVVSNQSGAVIYYSTADPATISLNPYDASNGTVYDITGNTVGWTTDKPEAGITAVRVIGGVWTPEDGDIVVTITMKRDGWVHGDVFSNGAGAVAGSTMLKMISAGAMARLEDPALAVPDTGARAVRQDRVVGQEGGKDDSFAVAMGMLFAGTFIGLAGIVGITVFALRRV